METRILYIVLNLVMILLLGCNNYSDEVITYKQLSPCDEIKDSLNERERNYRESHCIRCEKWNPPSQEELLGIFKKMDTLLHNLERNDYFSYIHNCGIEGEVLLKNIKYNYHLNAAGWVTLKKKELEKEIILGCNSEDCRKYFLSIRLTEAEIEGEEN